VARGRASAGNKVKEERAVKRILLSCVLVLMCSQAHAGESEPTAYYTALVYDGSGTLASIQQAMTQLGVPYELRGPANPVTAADLSSPYHNLLVVGWNLAGDMSGLPAGVLEGGITGRKVITGHDADYHFIHGYGSNGHLGDPASVAAGLFLMQAMAFARGGGGGGGCGLLALGDLSTGFSYLPTSWGVVAVTGNWDTVSAFTPEGQASGVYAGLTPAAMSDWANCYHNRFTLMGSSDFVPFEMYGQTPLTIATPEPATLALLGLGAAGLVARRRNKK
jgi:hypothetical protein